MDPVQCPLLRTRNSKVVSNPVIPSAVAFSTWLTASHKLFEGTQAQPTCFVTLASYVSGAAASLVSPSDAQDPKSTLTSVKRGGFAFPYHWKLELRFCKCGSSYFRLYPTKLCCHLLTLGRIWTNSRQDFSKAD